jgi:HK97 family phage prohead protease
MTATRFYTGSVEPLSELEVLIVASTSNLALDGHVLEAYGVDLSLFRKHPSVLWSHDPKEIVGTMPAIGIVDDKIAGKVEFAPIGCSARADEVRALVKSGVVTGVSVGFDILESTPLDKNKPRAGLRITKSRLLECSFVAVPADAYAGVTARHHARTAAELAMIATLPKTPRDALTRAAARFSSGRSDGRLVSPTMQTYLLLQASEERQGHSFSARQREIERLRQIGRQSSK